MDKKKKEKNEENVANDLIIEEWKVNKMDNNAAEKL